MPSLLYVVNHMSLLFSRYVRRGLPVRWQKKAVYVPFDGISEDI